MSTPDTKLGWSGRIAKAFLREQITPLIALSLLLIGGFAVLITPREEEPQINVTTKLIAILQQQGVIRPTSPAQLSAFSLLLSQVYQDEGLLTYPKD